MIGDIGHKCAALCVLISDTEVIASDPVSDRQSLDEETTGRLGSKPSAELLAPSLWGILPQFFHPKNGK